MDTTHKAQKFSYSLENIPYFLKNSLSEFNEELLLTNPLETLTILSYFATSLYDKNTISEVLWDITENCISYLNLEDCVIYMLDREKKYLVQKAAYGNKTDCKKKIISPLKIKVGNGYVGKTAKTGKYNRIDDVTLSNIYIKDDLKRKSELTVPIYIDNNIIGVLDSEHSQKAFFTDNHVYLFHLIAKLTELKLKQVINQKSSINITGDNKYFKKLEILMTKEKIFRDPNISLINIANQLKISGNYLSQLINTITGKNFADYINSFRVEDAKLKLTNNRFLNYTVISIGLESGFNSKSTFYSAFKKMVGISPSIYRKTT
ncbi:hypothetical protein BTO06_18180 [Tenacibaculum sp. SZ-18]|uniref:helix-turn-helix domain-containing protein n=1 Tax=Tenacibaculum sp. SZ-18 TaxID=754423 RepID=UPI000C2D4D9F|nr:helix-turn-helix domain-containing protein [Tenacibaculum sp. SZ-18]AUC16957.1 hypothetical protein BTO06_18180 [Tenacibaculum sp. SZ-18]